MEKCLFLVVSIAMLNRYRILQTSFLTVSIKLSKIIDCGLERIGELPNDFYNGACGTFKFSSEERVMFCFPLTGKNKCFR